MVTLDELKTTIRESAEVLQAKPAPGANMSKVERERRVLTAEAFDATLRLIDDLHGRFARLEHEQRTHRHKVGEGHFSDIPAED